ncbi:MAG: hypothetical protein ACOYL9_06080 [Ilumatobacteraceae bacterium]
MNDDHDLPMPSAELLAAAAAADGSASADQLAIIEQWGDLDGLTRDLADDRALVADLSTVPPHMDPNVREWSINAALAVYDQLHAAPVAATSNVVPMRRRPRSATWLSAAAAVVVVLGGFAVTRSLITTDNETSDTATVAEAEAAKTAATTDTQAAAATDAAADPVAGATGAATATQPAIDDAPPYTIGAAGAEVQSNLTSPESLRDFANVNRTTASSAETPAIPCIAVGDEVLGNAAYNNIPAIITRDPATGTVTAYDSVTCAVLASVEP